MTTFHGKSILRDGTFYRKWNKNLKIDSLRQVKKGITVRTRQEFQCLPHAGFIKNLLLVLV